MGIYQLNQNLKKQTAIYRIENCHQDTCDFQNDWSSATHNVLAAPPGRCLLIRDQKRRPFPQDQWHDCTFPIGPSFHIDISVGSTFSILTYIWLIFFNGKCRSILPSWTPLIRHGRKKWSGKLLFRGQSWRESNDDHPRYSVPGSKYHIMIHVVSIPFMCCHFCHPSLG